MSDVNTTHSDIKHGSYLLYFIGFIFSIILTLIPFYTVIQNLFNKSTIIIVLFICAFIQIIVHLVCFLNLRISSEYKWNLIAFIFTVIIITILVAGSLWIMQYLTYNLMSH